MVKKLARTAPRIAAQLLLGLGVPATGAAPALAQDFPLTRLVDDRMVLPGGFRAFGPIEDFALDAAGNLAFTSGGRAFAIIDGLPQVLSDPAVPVDRVEIDAGRVFWSERGDGGDAILGWQGGASFVVVDEDTQVPGTECLFRGGSGGFAEGWRRIDVSIVFHGASDDSGCEDVEGTYRWKGGRIEVLADRRTSIEDHGKVLQCEFADLEGDRILRLCAASGAGSGVYLFEPDGTWEEIAGPGYRVPVGGSVDSATLRDGVVAFLAYDGTDFPSPGGPGVPSLHTTRFPGVPVSVNMIPRYKKVQRDWTWRHDYRHLALQLTPWESGPFLSLYAGANFYYVGSAIDFSGLGREVRELELGEYVGESLPLTIFFDDGTSAVYAASGGTLARVLGPGDALGGRSVRSARLGHATGRSVVVGVDFTDGCATCGSAWDALYAGEIEPEPVVIPQLHGIRYTRPLDEHTLLPDGSPALDGLGGFIRDPSGSFAFTNRGRIFASIDGEIRSVGAVRELDDEDVRLNRLEIDRDRVFWSEDVSDERGGGAIHVWEDGASALVVGEDTPISGTPCTFWGGGDGFQEGYNWHSIGGGRVLFWGIANDGGSCESELVRGTFLWRDGTIEPLAPTVIEDGGRRLECSIGRGSDPSLRYCRESQEDRPGLYLFSEDGTWKKIAAPGDPVPGRPVHFVGFGPTELRDGKVAFIGYEEPPRPRGWEPQGVYVWDGSTIHTIANAETLGIVEDWYWRFRFDGRRVVVIPYPSFLHFARPDGSDARSLDLGVLESDLDRELSIEWPGDLASDWLPLTVSSGRDYTQGVYAARADGALFRILGPGDELDGRTVRSASMGESIGSTLTVAVFFDSLPCCEPHWEPYVAHLPPVPVVIDVRPGRRRNRIHPTRRELVPVGLLGSPDLEVADVDAGSLVFGPNGARPWRGRSMRRDVNGDGLVDLLARFRQRETGIARGDVEACLSGETTDGIAFEGCDAVRTPPRRANPR